MITLLIIILGICTFYGYGILTTPKIASINIVEASYSETGENLEPPQICDKCTKGYYTNYETGEQICPQITINGVDIQDCKPHKDILCIGGGIDMNFNLNVNNFKSPIYCEVSSMGETLTNPFLAYQGTNKLNSNQISFGQKIDKNYKLKVCCSTETTQGIVKSLISPTCSEEYRLEPRCWP